MALYWGLVRRVCGFPGLCRFDSGRGRFVDNVSTYLLCSDLEGQTVLIDLPNLDGMNKDELQRVARVASLVATYANNSLVARRDRLAGRIQDAIVSEAKAEKAYHTIKSVNGGAW